MNEKFLALNHLVHWALKKSGKCPMCDHPEKNNDICKECIKEITYQAEKYENERYQQEWK